MVTNTTFSGNSASEFGGGIDNKGTLTVTNSTLAGNSAAGGGGILNDGTLRVTNSTLSGNSASGFGGGIYNYFFSTLTVTNSTLSGNSASLFGGGIASFIDTFTLADTIIATNTAPTGPDVDGTATSLGHNLIGKAPPDPWR
jgi:predicted outer membrane repeat protein